MISFLSTSSISRDERVPDAVGPGLPALSCPEGLACARGENGDGMNWNCASEEE
jgi:hypothetical protein